jgi:hypothetical protein
MMQPSSACNTSTTFYIISACSMRSCVRLVGGRDGTQSGSSGHESIPPRPRYNYHALGPQTDEDLHMHSSFLGNKTSQLHQRLHNHILLVNIRDKDSFINTFCHSFLDIKLSITFRTSATPTKLTNYLRLSSHNLASCPNHNLHHVTQTR